jgi:hypothetical protein
LRRGETAGEIEGRRVECLWLLLNSLHGRNPLRQSRGCPE